MKATLVCYGNINFVYMSGNPIQQQRIKHIEIDVQFVHEKVVKGQICVLHVSSCYQIANIFTKGFLLQLFDDLRDSLNIRQPSVSTTRAY